MPHLFKVTAAANVALYRTRAQAVGESAATAPSKTHGQAGQQQHNALTTEKGF
jgi:hypothetical protein